MLYLQMQPFFHYLRGLADYISNLKDGGLVSKIDKFLKGNHSYSGVSRFGDPSYRRTRCP